MERPYRMRINAEDEQYLRQAAALINSQADSYAKMYAYNTTQRFEDTGLEDRLTEINRLLDSVD